MGPMIYGPRTCADLSPDSAMIWARLAVARAFDTSIACLSKRLYGPTTRRGPLTLLTAAFLGTERKGARDPRGATVDWSPGRTEKHARGPFLRKLLSWRIPRGRRRLGFRPSFAFCGRIMKIISRRDMHMPRIALASPAAGILS
ncbi:unnamed protein product, partial [Iphiclides podalirius]